MVKLKKRKWFIADAIIWDNFERFREERGLTYAEIARGMDVSPQHLAQIKAKTLGIGPETLARMAKVFGKKEEEFFEMHTIPKALLVPKEIVDIYPRIDFIVDTMLEIVKYNPTPERLLEYAINLLKTELSLERMRTEETRLKKPLSPSKRTGKTAPRQ